MRPEIKNLKARMSGEPLTKYEIGLSKTEYVKLLEYVAELEQLRIHDVVGRSEQLVCDCGNKHKRNTYEIHIGRCQYCLKDIAD